MTFSPSRWLKRLAAAPQPLCRLVCFPHAGASATVFYRWAKPAADSRIELVGVQLPGRSERLGEAPVTSIEEAAAALVTALGPEGAPPVFFFGYSMGALLAFEVCVRLRDAGRQLPSALIVAASRAPHQPHHHPPLHGLPDAPFLDSVHRVYQGIPTAVMQDSELKALITPSLRADFTMLETYAPTAPRALSCPITVFGGQEDTLVAPGDLRAWADLTQAAFRLELFPGGHFFLDSHTSALWLALARCCRGDR